MPAYRRKSHGPLAFWFLNHLLEKDELKRQIGEFKKRGYAGFFMHPRPGLLTPYASEEWYDLIGFCVREAKQVGLEAWLYDEDPYPSGMAGGRVTMNHPEWRASYLEQTVLPVKRAGCQCLDLPKGPLIGAFLVSDGQITRIDRLAGLVRTDWTLPRLGSYSYYPPFTAQGSPHWRADAHNQHYRLALDIRETPATLIAFTRHYAQNEPWGEYADLLNPKAVTEFIELTHKEYQRRFGKEFGKTIPGIFTDEPKAVGLLPWSETLDAHFRSIAGKSLVDCLPHLIVDIDDRTLYFRWAYREAISRAFKTAYIDQIETFCRKAGIASTGHISPEEDPIGQAVMTPGLINWLGGMTIPGTDLIGSEIGDARHALFHLSPKIASSAAHTRGKTDVLCEAFAVVDWVQNTSWMGRAINWLYALGVNQLCTHGQFYSIDGLRKREAPPSQFYQASYWEHFGGVTKYVENLSRELTRGRHAAPVLVYYPGETFMALATVNEYNGYFDGREDTLLCRLIASLVDLLLTRGYDFDFVDAEGLAAATVRNRKICLRGEVYEALLVPGGRLRNDTGRLLKRMETQRVPVVALQRTIPLLAGGAYRPARTTTLEGVLRTLSRFCRPVVRAEGRLLAHKRIYGRRASLFLVNNGDETFSDTVHPDFPGPYEILDLQTGESRAAPESGCLELQPGRGILVRQQTGKRPRNIYINPSDWKAWLDISNEWTAYAAADNCLVLSEFRMKGLEQLNERLPECVSNDFIYGDPLVDLLSAEASLASKHLGRRTCYWTSFELRDYRGPLALVRDSQLGPPADHDQSGNFRFFVNDHEVRGFRRRRRYDAYNREARIDGLVHEGRNFLMMVQELPEGFPREKGMPYDGVRLFGNFHVDFPSGRATPALLGPRPAQYAVGIPQQLGHPHYGGIFVYARNIQLPEAPERIALRFDKLYESADIRVNGKSAGILWQEPHCLEIPAGLFHKGANRLEILCSTSPANYLQALQRPSGFAGRVELCRA